MEATHEEWLNFSFQAAAIDEVTHRNGKPIGMLHVGQQSSSPLPIIDSAIEYLDVGHTDSVESAQSFLAATSSPWAVDALQSAGPFKHFHGDHYTFGSPLQPPSELLIDRHYSAQASYIIPIDQPFSADTENSDAIWSEDEVRTLSPSPVVGPARNAARTHTAPRTHPFERPIRNAAKRAAEITAAVINDNDNAYSSDGIASTEASEDMAGGVVNRRHHGAKQAMFALENADCIGKKKHNPWSLEETTALVEGVRVTGLGKWAEIKRLPIPGISTVLSTRSPVDLKDKWRNLSRVAKLPKATLKSKMQKNSDIPLSLILEVRGLLNL